MRPNVFSTNFSIDIVDVPDTRPGTWGNTGFFDFPIPFVNVPAGTRVRVTRIYGDFIMWPHGQIAQGSSAGGLTGLLTSNSGQSPFVGTGLGSQGCFFYIQSGCADQPARAPFDFNVANGGRLDSDNLMKLRIAVFLNNTGVKIHMETTMVVEFVYE